MIASRNDIKKWFQKGLEQKATHMIIVCDTHDVDDYPVYVKEGEDAKQKAGAFEGDFSHVLREVYNLSKDMEPQLDERKVFNY